MSRSLLRKRANDPSKKEIETWSDELSLFTDNIREVIEKFDSIDSEIWGKIIYMEKNRRLAKAYARSSPNQSDSLVRITNSKIGFDGLTIGLAGFPNPNRDRFTIEALSHLDQGIDVIMEESGNIVVVNQTESRIFIRGFNLPQPDNKRADGLGTIRLLPHQRETLFDINLYLDQIESRVSNQINLDLNNNSPIGIVINDNEESANDESNVYPIRRQLELETISLICFGRETWDLLETPSYLIIINIVALDILKAKIPQKYQRKVKRRRLPLSFLTQLTESLSGSTSSINLTRSGSPGKDSDSSSSEISVATTEASYRSLSSVFLHPTQNYRSSVSLSNLTNNLHLSSDYYPSSSSSSSSTKTATIAVTKNINKLVGINQLQENNRSASWSTLTTSNHHNLGSIKLPKPDYDQQNKHHSFHHQKDHNYTLNNNVKYTRRESTLLNPTIYSGSQTLPSRTGSKSRSFIDISTETTDSWSEPQNQSKSCSSSQLSSQLEKIKTR